MKPLRAIGADKVQGYFLGKPQALDDILAAANVRLGLARAVS